MSLPEKKVHLQGRDTAPELLGLLLWVLPLNCKIKKVRKPHRSSLPLSWLSLLLAPVPAEFKAGCVLLRAWLATLERSKPKTSLGPLKQPQQRTSLSPGTCRTVLAQPTAEQSQRATCGRREAGTEEKPCGRAPTSLLRELGTRRRDCVLGWAALGTEPLGDAFQKGGPASSAGFN